MTVGRPPAGPRIVVIGSTGSGKTTLARRLSQDLHVPHVELDALFWDPGWSQAPLDTFRARVEAAVSGRAWIVDGNYSKARDIVWSRAEIVIWLDYSLGVILQRLILRTARRLKDGTELWNGNYESLPGVFSRDSIMIWALKTYRRHRREFPEILGLAEYAHLTVRHLRSPRQTDLWYRDLAPQLEIQAGIGR